MSIFTTLVFGLVNIKLTTTVAMSISLVVNFIQTYSWNFLCFVFLFSNCCWRYHLRKIQIKREQRLLIQWTEFCMILYSNVVSKSILPLVGHLKKNLKVGKNSLPFHSFQFCFFAFLLFFALVFTLVNFILDAKFQVWLIIKSYFPFSFFLWERNHIDEVIVVMLKNKGWWSVSIWILKYACITTRIILYWTLGASTTCFSHLLHLFLLQSILHISSLLLFCLLSLSLFLYFLTFFFNFFSAAGKWKAKKM